MFMDDYPYPGFDDSPWIALIFVIVLVWLVAASLRD